MSKLLGIDLGTQSVKALAYDSETRQALAVTSSPLNVVTRDDGSAEQHASWWLDALRDCLLQIPVSVRLSIDALSISGQQHGFVPIDADGIVLSPVKLWCDTSTAAECEEITRVFGGEQACLDQVGNRILPGYTASKILWLKKTRPKLYERLATILLPHDYLNFILTGERVMEAGDASGTGLLDIRERQWSSAMLDALDSERDLHDCLPRLVHPKKRIGLVQKNAAEHFGLLAGIPVATGGGDNMMGAIGTGNNRDGVLTMSLGTSGTVYGFSSIPIIDPQGEISAFCSSTGGWLPLFCTLNCTNATTLVRNLLDFDLEQFEQQLSTTDIGADGVVTLPFYQGERTPNLPDATASIIGLTQNNFSPANLLRATVEGVSFALRYGVDRLSSLGLKASEIRLTGGGAKSASWRQMIANVCNLPVVVPDNEEGAAFGAALHAHWMLVAKAPGPHDYLQGSAPQDRDLQAIIDTHVSVTSAPCLPQAEAIEKYRQAYSHYCDALALYTRY